MNLTQQQILTLQKICQQGIEVEKTASQWLTQLSEAEGIGQVHGRKIKMTYKDIQALKHFLAVQGVNATASSATFQSRETTSKVFANEKLSVQGVTDAYVLIQPLKQNLVLAKSGLEKIECPFGYGVTLPVHQLVGVAVSQLVLVENLEVFLKSASSTELKKLLHSDALLVYRGGQGLFSAKGSQALFQQFSGEKIGFFDFDPAGLCQLGVTGLDKLIVPDLTHISLEHLQSASREDCYYQQTPQYQRQLQNLLNSNAPLSALATQMYAQHLAIMQETLLSRAMPLSLISVRGK